MALAEPHINGELAIANALNVPPYNIWPSRYDEEGERLDPQPNSNYKERNKKSNINKTSKDRHVAMEAKYAS